MARRNSRRNTRQKDLTDLRLGTDAERAAEFAVYFFVGEVEPRKEKIRLLGNALIEAEHKMKSQARMGGSFYRDNKEAYEASVGALAAHLRNEQEKREDDDEYDDDDYDEDDDY